MKLMPKNNAAAPLNEAKIFWTINLMYIKKSNYLYIYQSKIQC